MTHAISSRDLAVLFAFPLASLLLLAAASLASAQSGTSCNLYTSSSAPPAGYGAAWNPLTTAKELLISASCAGGAGTDIVYTVGSGASNQYIYKTGYYFRDSWKPYTLSGTFVSGSIDWLLGKGTLATKREGSINFWVGYVCHWVSNAWKCGCRDSACAQNYWQLQQVPAPASSGGSTGVSPSSCSTSSWNGTPCPPEAPRQYQLPSNPVRVTNSSELKNALAGSSARDIVLADGNYDNSGPFDPAAPHRLWAENLGGATLTAGIVFNSGAGAHVHGIRFNVNQSSKTSNNAILYTAGSGHYVTVEDSWFEANKTIGHGLLFAASDGVVVRRVVIRQVTFNGLEVDGYPHFASPPPKISDVNVYWVRNNTQSCCNGTGEFGVTLRAVTPGALVERAKVRWADWSCFLPIDAKGSIWRDLDCDWAQQPFYFEHYVDNSLLERFWFGPNSGGGVIIEPALPNWGWKPSGQNIKIQDGTIESRRYGVEIGTCNGKTTVQRVTFKGQCLMAINDSTYHSYGNGHCTPSGPNIITDNDYSQIGHGAKTVTKDAQVHGSGLCQDQWWKLFSQFP